LGSFVSGSFGTVFQFGRFRFVRFGRFGIRLGSVWDSLWIRFGWAMQHEIPPPNPLIVRKCLYCIGTYPKLKMASYELSQIVDTLGVNWACLHSAAYLSVLVVRVDANIGDALHDVA
jgi:hypothetical protein